MEIVVVSDTVRQRRSRTPSSSAQVLHHENGNKNDLKINSKVMPDVLPKTFHLAETSALFMQVNNNPENLLAQTKNIENCQSKFSIVAVRETNLSLPKSVYVDTNDSGGTKNQNSIWNTCSILESVSYLEPSRVETVHIIDATSEPSSSSDTETSCSTPNLDDRPKNKAILFLSDDEDSDEYDYRTGEPAPKNTANKRTTHTENKELSEKERYLLKGSEQPHNLTEAPPKPHRKKLTPTLGDILSAASDRDSFNSADNEVYDEPFTFSDDEDFNQLGGPSTEKFNRNTVLI